MKIQLEPRTLPEARAELARVDGEVSSMETELATLRTRPDNSTQLADLTNQLGAMTQRATTAESRVVEVQGLLATAQAQATAKDLEITNLTSQVSAEKEKVKDFDARVDAAAKDKAINILAGAGMSALKIGASLGQDVKASDATGRDRVAASFKKDPRLGYAAAS